MRLVTKIKDFLKKHKIFIGLLVGLFFSLWIEFNLFDFSFFTLTQKNLILFLLFQINLILILLLLYFIFRYIIKIFYEIRIKKISKSLKIKLFLIYFISIVFPSLVLVLGSFFFFKKTLDYWLKEFLEEKVLTVILKPEDYIKDIERDLLSKGQKIIQEYLTQTEEIKSSVLRERYRYFMRVDSIEVFDWKGTLVKKTYSSEISQKIGIAPSFLEKLKASQGPLSEVSLVNSNPYLRVFIPFYDQTGKPLLLAIGKFLKIEDFTGEKEIVEKRYFKTFKQFLMAAGTLVLLLVVFVGVWVGSKIGRNLTEPLQNLVVAAQKISKKDFNLEEIKVNAPSDDEVGRLIKAFNEMTKKIKEYEEEVQNYNRYLLSVLDHLPVGILVLTPDLKVKFSNQNLKRLIEIYGFSTLEELIERLNLPTLLSQIDLTKPFYTTLSWSKEEKEVSLGITLLKLEFLKNLEYLLIFENLEEKERLKRLSFWKEVALRVSHEIKNPLTPIKLSVERLKRQLEKTLEGEKKEVLLRTTNIIEKYIEELRKLATDFHYFTKNPVLNLEKGTILESILEVVSLYEIAYPEVKFHLKVEDEGQCLFDHFQLKRVWVNLLDNSIKAMHEKGEIFVSINREKDWILIKIEDTGEGVPWEITEKINQGDLLSLKDLGTGLIMVYSIINLHKGYINLCKKEEKGTSIIIKLPVQRNALEEKERQPL
ncbi:HAMP domain-containing protein [Thermodesulfobacterium sp. TA1]|uniref:sensor histidine kinase n=1 Tax=Thermodesulfobacterium sp. TA1 TaxID=2234087 RepID=UPI0012328E7A|nr:ATP-binding protein [Thermodesulfobacterium sp. TA1]QER42413.1 HAMP domain-containing protein [Thermodesulfobacterium sp. TA1]